MIRIICLFLLSAVASYADTTQDKFDVSISAVALKANTVEFTLKIVNQSPTPVQIDLSGDAVVLKAGRDKPSLQVQTVATRPGIYKPRVVLLVPGDHVIFLPSKTSRLFAPKTVAAGATIDIVKTVSVDPIFFLKDIATQPYHVFANLAYRVDGNPNCLATDSSPTYQMAADSTGTLSLTP